MSRAEYKNILGEEICEYCPWKNGEIDHSSLDLCEGRWCDEAMDGFIEENGDYIDHEE